MEMKKPYTTTPIVNLAIGKAIIYPHLIFLAYRDGFSLLAYYQFFQVFGRVRFPCLGFYNELFSCTISS